MEKEIKVSVILPSLNVRKYIEECLESVCRQSLKEIEILCIDAGSTDGTQEVIREFQKRDPRVSVILSEKQSYGYQVNLGIKKSRGKYIGIVDTDDVAKPDMFESLFWMGEKYQVDFVKSDYYEYAAGVKKRIQRIVKNEKYYHCVLIPSEHPEIFRQLYPAVWSGIYRRQFLEEKGIRCNETPGASYQDTGFWILTYAFARKAYFLDKPYYLYRTDNAGSSVYNPEKIYCICDEWKYVAETLYAEMRLKKFTKALSFIFYRKYKRNLERSSEDLRTVFLERFSKDFRKWKTSGNLSCEMFSEEEQNELNAIMKNPGEYYKDLKKRQMKFLKNLESRSDLILYGAGKIGKELLNRMGTHANVICIAVTEKCDRDMDFMGVPIRCIDELKDLKERAYVVIAVMTEEYRIQIERKLKELGFVHVQSIPYGLFDD